MNAKGIPAAECTAWSASRNDSILVTAALPNEFCSILEYWYSKPEADLEFLQTLCDFLTNTVRSGITHPDFHAGNLMTNGKEIVMIDPVGIKETAPTNSPDGGMLIPLFLAFGEIPMEEIAAMLHRSGLYNSLEETLKKLRGVEKQQFDLIEREWEKRKKQILSGSSKFAVETEPGKFLRNSAWFSSGREYTEDMLETFEFLEEEAKQIWLHSFRCQLMKKKCEKIPVIYEKDGKKVKISLLKNKKELFFYGFR